MTVFSHNSFTLVFSVIIFNIFSLYLHLSIIKPAVDSDDDFSEPSCDFIHV